MASPHVPLDDKAKRTRDLLSSFYSPENRSSMAPSPGKSDSVDTINSPSFDPNLYMNLLVQKSNLEGLLQRHVEMAAEIKNLDTDLQMLVYENYNKFISATDTIKRMKSNITGMEANMEQLLEKILSVKSRSDGVNTSLFERRERIEKLHRTRNLLRKVQFIHELPSRLGKCIKTEAYADAVKLFTGAQPIFMVYGDSSFHECKEASEEAMGTITKKLLDKIYSDSEPIAARAEAVALLTQLNYPVDSLKVKLLENLEVSLVKLQNESEKTGNIASSPDEISRTEKHFDLVTSITNEISVADFAESIRAYQIIFPDSERRLIELAQDFFMKRFEVIEQQIRKRVSCTNLMEMLRTLWEDVKVVDEVVPEAALPTFSLEVASNTVRKYISSSFSHLLSEFSEVLTQAEVKPNERFDEEGCLQIVLNRSKKAIIQGSMDLLLDFRQLLADHPEVLLKLRDLIIDWVQEGFQNFFRSLEKKFHLLSGGNISLLDGSQPDKVSSGLILVLAQIAVFIEQNAVPRITEEIAGSFSGGGSRGHEDGPAFVPGEICRIFRSTGEKFLQLYTTMKTQKISVLLRKRFTTPNWTKHKEPREVHMFVDLLLHEFEVIGAEVRQLLPGGIHKKHNRSDSAGSTVSSSRSTTLREDKIRRSHTQRARSQLFENHLAKLFKQRMEIFTKIEHTQESIISTIVKLCLKSLQEFVRLQTLNRSGFQQIQLDVHFLRSPLNEFIEYEAAIDFLLDEVIVAAAERCLDPIPLEPAILDKLIQAKLTKRIVEEQIS